MLELIIDLYDGVNICQTKLSDHLPVGVVHSYDGSYKRDVRVLPIGILKRQHAGREKVVGNAWSYHSAYLDQKRQPQCIENRARRHIPRTFAGFYAR